MRASYEDEEQELEQLSHQPLTRPDRELTLSSSTLLGIFFALVLLCGLFFAFGYTLGRRTPYQNAASPNTVTGEAIPTSFPAFGSKPKPSAASQPTPAVQTPEETSEATPTEKASTDSLPAETQPVPKPTAAQPLLQLASTEKPASTPLAITQSTLVQIAAIANPADADVLIRALRKRGYEVNVRREPTDALIHVQLGPFPNRADALAMRQKLLSDGYNAMLK